MISRIVVKIIVKIIIKSVKVFVIVVRIVMKIGVEDIAVKVVRINLSPSHDVAGPGSSRADGPVQRVHQARHGKPSGG